MIRSEFSESSGLDVIILMRADGIIECRSGITGKYFWSISSERCLEYLTDLDEVEGARTKSTNTILPFDSFSWIQLPVIQEAFPCSSSDFNFEQPSVVPNLVFLENSPCINDGRVSNSEKRHLDFKIKVYPNYLCIFPGTSISDTFTGNSLQSTKSTSIACIPLATKNSFTQIPIASSIVDAFYLSLFKSKLLLYNSIEDDHYELSKKDQYDLETRSFDTTSDSTDTEVLDPYDISFFFSISPIRKILKKALRDYFETNDLIKAADESKRGGRNISSASVRKIVSSKPNHLSLDVSTDKVSTLKYLLTELSSNNHENQTILMVQPDDLPKSSINSLCMETGRPFGGPHKYPLDDRHLLPSHLNSTLCSSFLRSESYRDVITPIPLVSGFFISQFDMVNTIAYGGSSIVFLARHKLSNILYAIKVIPILKLKSVLREVKMLASLSCDYVVRYYFSWIELISISQHERMSELFKVSNNNPLLIDKVSWRTNASTIEDQELYAANSATDSEPSSSSYSHSQFTETHSSEMIIEEKASNKNRHQALFMQMEYYPTTLSGYLEERTCVDRLLNMEIQLQITQALLYLHQIGVVHGDIKPSNIFLKFLDPLPLIESNSHSNKDVPSISLDHDSQGDFFSRSTSVSSVSNIGQKYRPILRILLGDLGISSVINEISQDSNSRAAGTHLYASWEQRRGEVLTPATDLFSAALVCAEIYLQPTTVAERYHFLDSIRLGNFPKGLLEIFPELIVLRGMVHKDPSQRTELQKIHTEQKKWLSIISSSTL